MASTTSVTSRFAAALSTSGDTRRAVDEVCDRAVEHLGAVAELAMVSPWQSYNVSAEGGKLPEQVEAGWCSWNFFSMLGVHPARGRSFAASDDRREAEATVMLSSPFLMRRYDGDPGVIGRKI